MESEQLLREAKSSIVLQRAKDGTYYWDIKVYYEDGHQDDAVLRTQNIDTALRIRFLETEKA